MRSFGDFMALLVIIALIVGAVVFFFSCPKIFAYTYFWIGVITSIVILIGSSGGK